ncbi:12812_t:CDS:10 [Ambispora leptoticha]|uniref:RNA helicase n=1 Tax=Ambispora leptoticha TaxID=144679 RepID=A0A9N9C8G5_9GLOM|nr:12812_t:CDS:10 [Ambispora leptoticha]
MASQNTATPDASIQTSSNGEVDLVTEKFDDLLKSQEEDIKHSSLQETSNEVEIQTAQAGSELLSVKSFEELGLGLYEMGFSRPSKIQEKALPLLLADPPQNMIGQSQSGTGKTAAFALTMLSRIDYDSETTQAMCLAPTRELARQITSVIKKMGKYTKLTLTEAIKDAYDRTQKINSHLIVGTPGTLTEMIRKRLVDPKNVKIFVLDEADNMLDQQSLGDQSIRLKNMMPQSCQIVLFSATFSDQVRTFAERFAPNSNQFKLKTEELSVEAIRQYFMDCKSAEHKFEVLDALYTLLTIGQSIIFVQKRETADTIARRMTEMGHKVINIHGGLSPTERDQVMDGFRRGDAKVLITTNVLSRGIDVLQVNLVINYDLPVDVHGNPDYETYLHRIGRTGRFGRTGASINFVHDTQTWNIVKSFENYFGREIIRVATEGYGEIERLLRDASTPILIGLGVTIAALTGRHLIKKFPQIAKNAQNPLSYIKSSRTPMYKQLYMGGFEQKVDKKEALLILGLKPNGLNKAKLKDAHRRIMLANHPDRDGSPYIASKINEAKDCLEKTVKS